MLPDDEQRDVVGREACAGAQVDEGAATIAGKRRPPAW